LLQKNGHHKKIRHYKKTVTIKLKSVTMVTANGVKGGVVTPNGEKKGISNALLTLLIYLAFVIWEKIHVTISSKNYLSNILLFPCSIINIHSDIDVEQLLPIGDLELNYELYLTNRSMVDCLWLISTLLAMVVTSSLGYLVL
jgi:hypothetical protein